MINTGLGVSLVAVATLCAAAMIGLGFLARPSRSTAIWAFAFTLTMVGSYGWVAADALSSLPLRAACAGALLGANALVWIGLRERRAAARSLRIPAFAYAIASPVVLAATANSASYSFVFRIDFAVAAAVAALTIAELLRLGARMRDVAMPLVLSSGAYVAIAIVSLIDGAVQFAQSGTIAREDGLSLIRELNSVGSLVYVISATITLLLLTRDAGGATAMSSREPLFRQVATDRLDRARKADDLWWTLLDIRLDDPIDLRDATSSDTFALITERFARQVYSALPADADIDCRSETRFVALLPRPESSVRQMLSRLLADVAAGDDDAPVSVRLSASIGWASVASDGYGLDGLLAAAEEGADAAQALGGDRWERAGAATRG